MITKAQIIRKIGNPNLTLHKAFGEHYWYFVYDNGEDLYDTHSVMVATLNDMKLESWVAEGEEFCKEIEETN